MQRGGGHRLRGGDREPRGDARALVDGGGRAQGPGEARHDLDEGLGHGGDEPRLLADHRHLVGQVTRVVSADLRTEPVLERGDDPSAVRVVLGVRAGDDEDVEGEAEDVATDLDVPLLHDVEHGHLDALGEVGELVDRDDAAVAAGDQPEVDRLGVTEASTLGHPHRVDVTDEVRDARVGGGELLGIPLGAVPPLDGQGVAQLCGPAPRLDGDGFERVLTELGAGENRRPLVEQAHEAPQEPGLPLPPLAEENDVVAREQGPLELGDDAGGEAVQSRPGVPTRRERGEEVVADLHVDRAGDLAGRAQLADGARRRTLGGRGRLAHRLTLRQDPVRRQPLDRPSGDTAQPRFLRV